jgi:prefoldin subunit 5
MSSSTEKQLPNVSESMEKIQDDIQTLQQMEQELLTSLETTPNLTIDQQQKIFEKVNRLSNMRVGLYETLNVINNFYNGALNSSVGTLKEQTSAIGIVESELNRSKKRLEYLETEKNNKIRLVEINEYYGDKYAEHTNIMKIIIFTLIPIIVITIIYNYGILPSKIYYIVFIIIGVVGALYFWKAYASIIMRDNMNYDEYAWSFDPNSAPKGTGSDVDPWLTSGTLGTCVGEFCCSVGQTYDNKLNQCIGSSNFIPVSSGAPATTTEAFSLPSFDNTINNVQDNINNILTKMQPGKNKVDVDLKGSINAYNS